MRVVPAVAWPVGAFFAAQQAVSHHRAIKGLVILGLMAHAFRFDMVYLRTCSLLFAFPTASRSGVEQC
jgi:hypothetical protein